MKILSAALTALTVVALLAGVGLARADEDPRIERNPAIARIAAHDPEEARRILDDIGRALLDPSPPKPRGGDLNEADEALVARNPLIGILRRENPAAALDMIRRIRLIDQRRK